MSSLSAAVINEAPESRYNNIIDGTPLGGADSVSFSDFNGMTESALLGLLHDANISFGKRGALLALKAQLSGQQGKTASIPHISYF
jgi:hypothetical protein